MENEREEKGFLEKQKEEWKAHIFRRRPRRWWGFVGLGLSLGMMYFGVSDGPWVVASTLPPAGVLEGTGLLFGSLAELMPEEQDTLAGILRLWGGLFVVCGFALMVAGGITGA